MTRLIVSLLVLLALPGLVIAQEARASVGGSVNVTTQTHSDDQPVGGTTLGGSASVGVRVSKNVVIEFEPSFNGSYSWEYTYRPSPSLLATVVATRRDTFFPVQARVGTGILEPVIGVAIVHSKIARHATIGNTTYFDDGRSENDLALVAGLNAAIKLTSRVSVVPTLRVLVRSSGNGAADDPLGEQTATGGMTFKYGLGLRAAF